MVIKNSHTYEESKLILDDLCYGDVFRFLGSSDLYLYTSYGPANLLSGLILKNDNGGYPVEKIDCELIVK